MIGRVHSFQSLGTLDGPGVRFVVFMHGCPLHCGYCHNIDVCKGAFTEYSTEEIIEKVLRYREYFGDLGGITLSGGEPLLQSEFVAELFALCKENGIHTVLDTSGSIWNDSVARVLDVCDLVLLDIKMTTEEDYQKQIGCSLSAPLEFLNQLENKGIPCWIRHVVVGGLNDNAENIHRLSQLIQGKSCVQKVELLPFHKLCATKYKKMGLSFPFETYWEPTKETMVILNEQIKKDRKP